MPHRLPAPCQPSPPCAPPNPLLPRAPHLLLALAGGALAALLVVAAAAGLALKEAASEVQVPG